VDIMLEIYFENIHTCDGSIVISNYQNCQTTLSNTLLVRSLFFAA
jgi:hypothetical protein